MRSTRRQAAEQVDVVGVPELMRHHRDVAAAPNLAHALHGVVAERENQLRHSQAEIAADFKPAAVGREQRLAQVQHVGASHVAAKYPHDHIGLYRRVALANIEVDEVAALLNPSAHGVRGHQLAFALHAGNLPEADFRAKKPAQRLDCHVVAYLLLDRFDADGAQLAVRRLAVPVALDGAKRERTRRDLALDFCDKLIGAAVLVGNTPSVLLSSGRVEPRFVGSTNKDSVDAEPFAITLQLFRPFLSGCCLRGRRCSYCPSGLKAISVS